MSLQIGDVYARIGLQMATGQFSTASQAIRSLGYDMIYLSKQIKRASDDSAVLEKAVRSYAGANNEAISVIKKTNNGITSQIAVQATTIGQLGKMNKGIREFAKIHVSSASSVVDSNNKISNSFNSSLTKAYRNNAKELDEVRTEIDKLTASGMLTKDMWGRWTVDADKAALKSSLLSREALLLSSNTAHLNNYMANNASVVKTVSMANAELTATTSMARAAVVNQTGAVGQAIKGYGYYETKALLATKHNVSLTDSFIGLVGSITKTHIAIAGVIAFAAGAGLAAILGKQIVETASEFELLNVRIKGVSKTSEEFYDNMNFIKRVAVDTPLSVDGVARAFADLEVVGINARDVLPEVADAMAATGATADKLHPIVLALSQVVTKGRVSMEELSKQLGNNGIPALAMLQKHFKTSASSADEWAKIIPNSTDAVYALAEEMNKAFGGSSQAMMATMSGSIEKLRDSYKFWLLDIGNNGFFESVKDDVNNFRQAFDELTKDKSAEGFATRISTALVRIKNAFILMLPSLKNGGDALVRVFQGVALVANVVAVAVNAVSILINAFMSGLNAMGGLITAIFKTVVDGVRVVLEKIGIPDSVISRFDKASKYLGNGMQYFTDNAISFGKGLVNSFDDGAAAIDNIGRILSGSNGDIKQSTETWDALARALGFAPNSVAKGADDAGKKLSKLKKELDGLSKLSVGIPDFNTDTATLGVSAEAMGLIDTQVNQLTADYYKNAEAITNIGKKFPELRDDANDALNKLQSNFNSKMEKLGSSAESVIDSFNEFQTDSLQKSIAEQERAGQKRLASFRKTIDDMKGSEELFTKYQIANAEYTEKQIAIIKANYAEGIKQTNYQTSAVGASQWKQNQITFEATQSSLKNQLATGQITQDQYNAQAVLNASQYNQNKSDMEWSGAQAVSNAIGSNVGGSVGIAAGIAGGNYADAAAQALQLMADNSPEMADALNTINDAVGQIFASLGKVLAPVFKLIGKIMQRIAPFIEKIFDALGPILDVLVDAIAPVLDAIMAAVEPLADLLGSLVGVIKSIGDIGGDIAGGVGDIFEPVTSIFGFADGGISSGFTGGVVDAPIINRFGTAMAGEAGAEAIIPLRNGKISAVLSYSNWFKSGAASIIKALNSLARSQDNTIKEIDISMDEVPSILQTGEIVLSSYIVDKAMNDGASFQDMAQPSSGGGVTIQQNISVSGTGDKQLETMLASVARQSALQGAKEGYKMVAKDFNSNGTLRKTLRRK